MIKNLSKTIPVMILILGALPSCTLEPVRVTTDERATFTKDTLASLHANKQKNLKIDLKKAIELALENNLEYRLKKVQAALQSKQYDLAKTELYPNIDLKLDYNHRNRDYIKTLADVSGGESSSQSLIPHTIKTGSIVFNWDIFDFGLSYVRAQQASDRYLLALEQRKQMAASIINDVIKNYTLAYYGQEVGNKIQELESAVNSSLDISDKAIDQAVGEMQQHLSRKKSLITDFREAKQNLVYFTQSRDKLLNLINYHALSGSDELNIVLDAPDPYLLKLPSLNSNLLYLDTVALYYRPEVSASIYKVRETEKQKIAVTLEKLPGLGFKMGYNYESDKYLKFQNWWSDNLNLAWNLMQLANIPVARETAEMQLESEKLTQLASSAVILGEVRVLLYNYKMKKSDYLLAEKESKYAANMYNYSVNMAATGLGDEQALVSDKIMAMNSELSKLRAFVDARNLFEDLITALGLYHQAGEFINQTSVDVAIINKWMQDFSAKEFDAIIKQEYKNVESTYKLAENSEVHKSEQEKPMPEIMGDDKQVRLEFELPTTDKASGDILEDIKYALAQLPFLG